MQIKELGNDDLISLALSTEDESVRQSALSEHNRRINDDPTVLVLPATATVAERKAAIEARLSTAA